MSAHEPGMEDPDFRLQWRIGQLETTVSDLRQAVAQLRRENTWLKDEYQRVHDWMKGCQDDGK